jgi:hypothetical protein
MGARAPILGVRRRNNTGSIMPRRSVSGALRYHVRLKGKYLGVYESRPEAERVLNVALAALAAAKEDL